MGITGNTGDLRGMLTTVPIDTIGWQYVELEAQVSLLLTIVYFDVFISYQWISVRASQYKSIGWINKSHRTM